MKIEKYLKIFANGVSLLLFLVLVFRGFVYFFSSNEGIYFNSDYFINYSSGFIKRGLDGEIIYFLSKIFICRPLLVIKLYYGFFFCSFAMIISFIWFKKSKALPFYYLVSPFILLPSLLFFNKLHLSKDLEVIVLGFFALQGFYKYRNFYLSNFLVILGTLVHEVFFLLIFFPFLFLFLDVRKEKASWRKFFQFIIFILPSLLMFLIITTVFSGMDKDLNPIYNSWYQLDSGITGKIHFNSGLFDRQGIRYIYVIIGNKINYLGILMTIILNFLFVLFLKINRKHFLVLSLQTIVVCGLIFMASDYYRWFLIANCLYIFYLSFEKLDIKLIPSIIVYFIGGMPYLGWNIYRYIESNPIFILIHLKKNIY